MGPYNMGPSITERLAEFIYYFDNMQLSSEVYEEAKKRIIDTIGCAIAAKHAMKHDNIATRLTSLLRTIFTDGSSTLIGESKKGSSLSASIFNSFLSHSLELDDSLPGVGHIGSVVVPVAFAVGEEMHSSGEELLRSVVLGYEIFSRIGSYNLKGHIQNRGFHPTGINGVFGAAAVASKLRRLNKEEITNALGLAGGFSSGLLEAVNDGSWSKRLNPGIAAFNGILATYLAENQFPGPRTILEGRLGFYNAYAGTNENSEEILKGLGKDMMIFKSKFKPYASCKIIHPAIDAILRLLSDNTFEASDIENVVVHMQSNGIPLVGSTDKRRPKNQVQAQFSLYYMVAYTILNRRPPLLEAIREDSFKDEKILALAEKVQIFEDKQIEPREDNSDLNRVSIVDLKLRDGRVITMKSRDNFDSMSMQEVIQKFYSITAGAISNEAAENFIESIMNIEKKKDITKILEIDIN